MTQQESKLTPKGKQSNVFFCKKYNYTEGKNQHGDPKIGNYTEGQKLEVFPALTRQRPVGPQMADLVGSSGLRSNTENSDWPQMKSITSQLRP